ncbi:MAG: chemotaxis protein CheX [Acidobacteria bacterium]|nr:chemotaxis protein CheX [Acidobacteriota bacterium]
MNHSAEKILYRKAALIFEELGFLMPQSDVCDNFQMDNPGSFVTFHGPFNGCLLISLTGEILSNLSSNMLGQEEPASKQMEEDALRELANVICGNALPAIFGLKEVFHLDTPSFCQNMQSVPKLSEYTTVAKVAIPFENGQASIFLYAESAGAEYPIAVSE